MSVKKVLSTPAPPDTLVDISVSDQSNDTAVKRPPNKHSWFACCLYPDFDADHFYILHYLIEMKGLFPELVYITHDKDHDEDGNLKKSHTHVLFRKAIRVTTSAMSRHLLNIHVESVNDWASYAAYMLHLTPESRGKYCYDLCDLKGSESIRKNLSTVRNSNFVLLKEISQAVQSNGGRLFDSIQAIGEFRDVDGAMEILRKYGSVISNMANQEFRLSYGTKIIKSTEKEFEK